MQDDYLERWVSLEEEATRECFQDACLLTAQVRLQHRLKRGGDIDHFEAFWEAHRAKGDNGVKFFENTARGLVP